MITKSKAFGCVLMFIGISFYVFMIFSILMQYSTVSSFVFIDLIGWHNLGGKILATFLTVYLSYMSMKFVPCLIVVLCAAIYIDVHFNGWSLNTVILLYIWPSIIAFVYCLMNKRLSIKLSPLSGKNTAKNSGEVNAGDENDH